MDNNLQREYVEQKAWGMSATIDIKNCNAEKIKSAATIQDYVIQLCKLIDMTRYGDCQVVNFGTGDKLGYSLVQLIETSCITGHFCNENGAAYIDIFSCKFYDPEVVAEFTQRFFDADTVMFTSQFRK